jgi:hypothetical protein
MVVADAVLPVRRTMLAAAQATADAARSTLPRLRRPTAILAEELATASATPDRGPIFTGAAPPQPPMTKRLCAASRGAVAGVAAIPIAVLAGLARWRLGRPAMASVPSLLFSLRSWRPSASRLHLLILGLALADAAIINGRADIVWAMPQTGSFFAAVGLPVLPPGIQLERLTTTAERHDGEPVLIVKGEIGNSASKAEDVPDLVFSIRNAERQEIYSWTAAPARRALSGGETLLFQSELALPPVDTREVVVRFVDRDNSL